MRLSILFLFITSCAIAQTRFVPDFTIPVTENNNPLRSPWAGGINFPWFSSIDLNGDTLQDLFLVDRQNNRIQTYINNGSTNRNLAWDYAPQFASQFPYVNKFAFLYD